MISNSNMNDDKAVDRGRASTSWKRSIDICFSPKDVKANTQSTKFDSVPVTFKNKNESKSVRSNPIRGGSPTKNSKEELHSKIFIPGSTTSPSKNRTTENFTVKCFHESITTTEQLHQSQPTKSNHTSNESKSISRHKAFMLEKLYVPLTQQSNTTANTSSKADRNAPGFSLPKKDKSSPAIVMTGSANRTKSAKPVVYTPEYDTPKDMFSFSPKKHQSYTPPLVIGSSSKDPTKDDDIPTSPLTGVTSTAEESPSNKLSFESKGKSISKRQSRSTRYVVENKSDTDFYRFSQERIKADSDNSRWHDSYSDPLVNEIENSASRLSASDVCFGEPDMQQNEPSPIHHQIQDTTTYMRSSNPASSHESSRLSRIHSPQHPQKPTFSIRTLSFSSEKRLLPKHKHQIFGTNHSSVAEESNTTPTNSRKSRNRNGRYITESSSFTSSSYNTSNNSSSKGTKVESIKTLRGPPTDPLPNDEPARAPIGDSAKSKISPQTYLDTLARSYGYKIPTTLGQSNMNISVGPPSTVSPVTYNDEDDDDDNDDTTTYMRQMHRKEFDYASFGFFTVGVARLGDVETMYTLLSAGMSPNACNEYGESLVRIVCRRGDYKTLEVLFQFNCDIDSLVDDHGRNPLHDACSCLNVSASLATVKLIMDYCLMKETTQSKINSNAHDDDYDPLDDIHCSAFRLFYKPDCYGALPLSYVPQENWSHWLQFLALKKDLFLPLDFNGDSSLPGSSTNSSAITTSTSAASSSYGSMPAFFAAKTHLILQSPTQHPIPLPVDVARMVASGKIPLLEAQELVAGMKGSRHNDDGNDGNSYSFRYCKLRLDTEQDPSNSCENEQDDVVGNLRSGKNDGVHDTKNKSQNNVGNDAQFQDISFYVEDKPIHKREKRLVRQRSTDNDSRTSHSHDNTIDSTAYPDSVSGIEFYCDTPDFKAKYSRRRQQSNPQNQQEIPHDGIEFTEGMNNIQWNAKRDRLSSDFDSTAYPDSVISGIEFYCESAIPSAVPVSAASQPPHCITKQLSVESGIETCSDDNDVDSTAFPDSISGVDFYSELSPVQRRGRKMRTRTKKEHTSRGHENGAKSHDGKNKVIHDAEDIRVGANVRSENESKNVRSLNQMKISNTTSFVIDTQVMGNSKAAPTIINRISTVSTEQEYNDEFEDEEELDGEDEYDDEDISISQFSGVDVDSMSERALHSNSFCSQLSSLKSPRTLRMEI